jgi:hypothetical protein
MPIGAITVRGSIVDTQERRPDRPIENHIVDDSDSSAISAYVDIVLRISERPMSCASCNIFDREPIGGQNLSPSVAIHVVSVVLDQLLKAPDFGLIDHREFPTSKTDLLEPPLDVRRVKRKRCTKRCNDRNGHCNVPYHYSPHRPVFDRSA